MPSPRCAAGSQALTERFPLYHWKLDTSPGLTDASQIVIDVRRIRDFGIGTYIRNLVHALGAHRSRRTATCWWAPADEQLLAGLPQNFRDRHLQPARRRSARTISRSRCFSAGFAPDLVHIPLNRVPLLMRKPYVVTIHDMASLLFDEAVRSAHEVAAIPFPPRIGARRPRDRRLGGDPPRRAESCWAFRPTACAWSTTRPIRVLRAPSGGRRAPRRSRCARDWSCSESWSATRSTIRSCCTRATSGKQKNIPRLVEAFAVVRESLADHPVYKDLRLIIIGDEISQHPAVRQAVIQGRVEHCGALSRLRAVRHAAQFLRIRRGVRVPVAL